MPLTDAKIRAEKSGESVRKLSDGGGLQLWLKPTGGKLWHFAYRFEGKQKKIAFGPYPEIGLATARKQRDKMRAMLAAGIDPGQQKRAEKAQKANSEANTFALVAAELLAKKRREGKASNTIGKREWLYGLAGESFGKRPLAEITSPEVLAVLRKVEARGLLETARRMRSSIGEVFRYGVATGRCESDPTPALRGALTAPTVRHRAALVEPIAFGGLLRAIEGFSGQPTTVAALKLLALTAVRPGELRLAEWAEFDFEKAVWTIPVSRMKMRRPHTVPLAGQALEILNGLRPFTAHGRLVFPGYGKTAKAVGVLEPKPISENTLNTALRRMGFGPEEMTSHGFRTSFSSMANEAGKWSPDAIERSLAHSDGDPIRGIYSRGSFWNERVRLAQWWADECERMRNGRNIIQWVRHQH